MNTRAMNVALDWLGWVVDHHFPAVALAVLLVILLILELRRVTR